MVSRRKIVIGGMSAIALCILVLQNGTFDILGIASAFAQANTSNTNIYHDAAAILGIPISAFEFLTYIIIHLLTALLDPKFILGMIGSGSGQEILRVIWQLSRDIMNVIFAFMLVVAALYMVVVPQKSDIVRSSIVKFIIAIILVNFSWFFPRVILDVANVTTASIYQIPGLLPTQLSGCQTRNDEVDSNGNLQFNPEPCTYIDEISVFDGVKKFMQQNPDAKGHVGDTVAITTKPLTLDVLSTPKGILNGLVYNHGRLENLTRIQVRNRDTTALNDKSDAIGDLIFFIMDTVFVFAMMSMLFFPLVAMLLAFILRMVIIWLTVAFMPFMFVSFILGTRSGIDTMDEIFWRFVKAAFLPALVAVPLVAGFIMINAMLFASPTGEFQYLDKDSGAFVLGVNTLWHFLYLLTTYMIIWKGFFFALSKSDTVYQGIGQSIQGIGGRVGSTILKAPLNLPVPVPRALDRDGDPNGRTTFGSLVGLNKKNNSLLSGGGGGGGGVSPDLQAKISALNTKINGNTSSQIHQDLNKILTQLQSGTLSPKQAVENYNTTIARPNSLGEVREASELKDLLKNSDSFGTDSRVNKL